MPDNDYQDDQEQSETFDETHLDDEGDGEFLLDEADQVLDVTQADGDADDEDFDEDAEIDLDDQLALDGIEREADALLGVDGENRDQIDAEGGPATAQDEVELVYSGLMKTNAARRPAPPTGRPNGSRTTTSPTWDTARTAIKTLRRDKERMT